MNLLVLLCSILWIATISTVAQEESNVEIFMKHYQECKKDAGTPKAPSMGAPPKPPGPPNPNECPDAEDEKKALTCTLIKMELVLQTEPLVNIKDKGMDAEKAKKMCTKMSPDQKKEFDERMDNVAKTVGKQKSDMDASMGMCREAAKHNLMKLAMECQ